MTKEILYTIALDDFLEFKQIRQQFRQQKIKNPCISFIYRGLRFNILLSFPRKNILRLYRSTIRYVFPLNIWK